MYTILAFLSAIGLINVFSMPILEVPNTKTVELVKWMDDLRFYILFNSISVISGQWAVGNERLLTLFTVELELGTARSAGQGLCCLLSVTNP